MGNVVYRVSPPVAHVDLKALFTAAWPVHSPRDFQPVLSRSLTYVCAYAGLRLVGFVNVAWDGGIHGFVLDTTVHPDWRRRGIGRELVRKAATLALERGLEWLHVDYEPTLESFYQSCGFKRTAAGILQLRTDHD